MVVQKHPKGGARLAIDETHHGLGQVGDRPDAQRIAPGHHQTFLQKGKPQDAALHMLQFLAGHDHVGFRLAGIVQVGAGHVRHALGQAAERPVTGGKAAIDAGIGRGAGDMLRKDFKCRIAPHQDDGSIQAIGGQQYPHAFLVPAQQTVCRTQAERHGFCALQREADQPIAHPPQRQTRGWSGRPGFAVQQMDRLGLLRRLFDEQVFHPAAEDTGQSQGYGCIGQITPGFDVVNRLAPNTHFFGQFFLRPPSGQAVLLDIARDVALLSGHRCLPAVIRRIIFQKRLKKRLIDCISYVNK